MARARSQNPDVREFILRNVAGNPRTISSLTGKRFGLSRTAVSGYMRRLLDEGCLDAEGKTSARRYALKSLSEAAHEIPISKWTEEDVVWRFRILPNVVDLGQDIVNICQRLIPLAPVGSTGGGLDATRAAARPG